MDVPAGSVFVAVPLAKTEVRLDRLNPQAERVGGWLILRRPGPIGDRPAIAAAISALLREARAATVAPYDPALAGYYKLGIDVADGAERRLRLDDAG